MTARVPVVEAERTIGEIHTLLSQKHAAIDTLHYVYVVDDARKIVGVLSIREVFAHKHSVAVGKVCTRKNLVTVHPMTAQERVAYLALKHGIKAVPVVDTDGTFLGAIPSDAILHILYRETHKDLLQRAGVDPAHPPFDNVLKLSVRTSVAHRLPWLFLGLLGGLLAAHIVSSFKTTLEQNIVLAAFIPLIVYMGSAAGTQMEALIIRDLAIDRKLPFVRYLRRQMTVVVSMAAVCAVLLGGLSYVFYRDLQVSSILATSLLVAVCSSLFTGLCVPYVFSRFRMDPANASGPLATIIQDILSLVLYFSIATALLR